MSEEIIPHASPYVRPYERGPIHRLTPKVGRNDICPLEGKKFKNCCGKHGYNYCVKLYNNYIENNIERTSSTAIETSESTSS